MTIDKEYKKNFLTDVIFRIDFTNIPNYDDPKKLKKFHSLIRGEFPIIEEKEIIAFEHKLEGREEFEFKRKKIKRWEFFNKSKKKMVSFEHFFLVVNFKEYTNFNEFSKTIKSVLTSLFKVFPTIVSTRTGLRYINQIVLEGKPFGWDNIINKTLFNSIDFVAKKKDTSRHVTLIEFNRGDHTLRFQYGIPNSVFPSPIIKREFMLDYDCFTQESLEKPQEIINKIKDFNIEINAMFEESIENGLRKIMGVVKK